MLRHRGGAPLRARQNQRLRDFRQSEFDPQGGGGGGESRNPGGDRIGNGKPLHRTNLFAKRAPYGEISRMQARDILCLAMRAQKFGYDFIEAHRSRIQDAGALRTMFEKRLRHERARVEADWRTRDKIAAAQGNKIGGPWPRADEVNGHGSLIMLSRPQSRSLHRHHSSASRARRRKAQRLLARRSRQSMEVQTAPSLLASMLWRVK